MESFFLFRRVVKLSKSPCTKSLCWLGTGFFVGMSPLTAAACPSAIVASTNSLTIVDTATNGIVKTVSMPVTPGLSAVSPTGRFAYVTLPTSGSVYVLDTSFNIIKSISVGSSPKGVAFSPDGKFAYVANSGSNNISIIDATIHSVVATIQVGMAPSYIAFNSNGSKAFVANLNSGTVSVINVSTKSVAATIQTGSWPMWIELSKDGSVALVANYLSNSITVINASTNAVISNFASTRPTSITFNSFGNRIFVTDESSSKVNVFTSAYLPVTSLTVGYMPQAVQMPPFGRSAYVGYPGGISVIDTVANLVTKTISLTAGKGPLSIIRLGAGLAVPPFCR